MSHLSIGTGTMGRAIAARGGHTVELLASLVVRPTAQQPLEIADALPPSRVLTAFDTTFAGTLAAGTVGPLPTTVLIAGDDAAEKVSWAGGFGVVA